MGDLIGFERKWLPKELSDIEQRVSDAFRSVSAKFAPRLTVESVPVGSTVQATESTFYACSGACTIVLPPPADSLRGAQIAIGRSGASGTVTVRASIGTVSGAATVSLSTSASRVFLCTGSTWL